MRSWLEVWWWLKVVCVGAGDRVDIVGCGEGWMCVSVTEVGNRYNYER